MSTFRHIPTFETLKSPSANSTVYDHPAKKTFGILWMFGFCCDFAGILLGFWEVLPQLKRRSFRSPCHWPDLDQLLGSSVDHQLRADYAALRRQGRPEGPRGSAWLSAGKCRTLCFHHFLKMIQTDLEPAFLSLTDMGQQSAIWNKLGLSSSSFYHLTNPFL